MSNNPDTDNSTDDQFAELVKACLPPACPTCGYIVTHCKCAKTQAIEAPPITAYNSLPNCPICDNAYLAIRTDIYKDKREFVYCDCCGAVATRQLWVLAGIRRSG